MSGGGSSGTTTEYVQSPEQRQVYNLAIPTLAKTFGIPAPGEGFNSAEYLQMNPDVAQNWRGGSAYDHYLQFGRSEGRQPGSTPYEGGGPLWDIPPVENLMPRQGWYEGLDQSVLGGMREPYVDASRQLTESMGGSAGSSMAGPSGMLGAAQSDFWNKAGTGMANQAWNMVGPAQQAGWNAQLQQNMYPYSVAPSLVGGAYSQPVMSEQGGGFSSSGLLGGAMAGGALGSMMAPAGATGLAALGGPWGLGMMGVGGLLGSGIF